MAAMDPDIERVYGCFAGLALGDALGMPVEFLTQEQIRKEYGWIEGLVQPPAWHPHHRFKAGTITDDTGQALAVARAYQPESGLTAEAVARELVDWADSLEAGDLTALIGPSTSQALENLRNGMDPANSGRQGTTNGAAMRAAPVGLANPGNLEGAVREAVLASMPTHHTSPAISGAAAVACAVAEAVREGSTIESILEAAKTGAERGRSFGTWRWSTPLEGRIELAVKIVCCCETDRAALSDLARYVGVDYLVPESVAAAFGIVFLARGDPFQAVLYSVNIGGDTDTIGAIAGAVCGAWKGIGSLPPALITQVEAANGFDLSAEALRFVQFGRARMSSTDLHENGDA